MKFTSFISCMLLLAIHAGGQNLYVQGGVNFANITMDKDGNTRDNNILTTLNAGLMVSFDMASVVDLETGLLFTGRGSKTETYFGNDDYVKARINPYYIELPLNLVVNFPLNSGTGIFVYGGPYAAVGVGGKSEMELKVGPLVSNSERDIQYNDDDPFTSEQEEASYSKLKRFDYGLNVGAGIMFSRIRIKAGYGLGLAKINSTESLNSEDQKNKYRTFSVSVGIPLGR